MQNTFWWQRAVIYQIYPRSFQDANGDGVGDLRGIAERLPYLVELGVDAIWISPVYSSPMRDFGYDVTDHAGIDPLFGTLTDFDELVTLAHGAGIRVLMDLVPNHTSDQHLWFQESCASRTNPRRDWYIWRDPAPDGGPPNNWLSEFGGSAWQLDSRTGQYYYHAFLPEQPDLNWRNPEVRRAMYDVMRFWLRRGVDGFRVDVIWHLIKDAAFRDNPPNPDFRDGMPPHLQQLLLYNADQPEVHDVIAEMRAVCDEVPERVLLGEVYLPIDKLAPYYGRDLAGLHFPFNFALLTAEWQATSLARLVQEYERRLPPGGWPNWVLGNHDRPRVASRLGQPQARLAAMLMLTLRGTPIIYYGDEIGLEDVAVPPSQMRDPVATRVPRLGRDGVRTPMQWDAGPFAGFSQVEPWLPLGADYRDQNVERFRRDPSSMYHLYRSLLALRRAHPALSLGRFLGVEAEGDVLFYRREHEGERLLVALNLGDRPATLHLEPASKIGEVLFRSGGDRSDTAERALRLEPVEGAVVRLEPAQAPLSGPGRAG